MSGNGGATTIGPDGTVHIDETAAAALPSLIPPGVTQLRLPDGRVIDLTEWKLNRSFRSALVIDSHEPCPSDWALFTYNRSQSIVGTNLKATRAHSNIPRVGDSGLPKDWEMYVMRWRATISMPLVQPVLDWATETAVQFEYNSKIYADATLLDLLLSPQSLDAPTHMQENLPYQVTVNSTPAAVAALREWLRTDSDASDQVRDAVAQLDTIIGMVSDANIGTALRRVQAKLVKSRALTVWVHFEGPLKVVIV